MVAIKAYRTAEKAAEAEVKDKGERQQKQFSSMWQQNMQETIKEIPESAPGNTPLRQKVEELFAAEPVFNFIPNGFGKATALAKVILNSGQASALEAKKDNQIKELTAKVSKYEKMLSIEGSGPVTRVSPKSFDQLSMEEQEKALEQMTREAGMINF